MVGQPRSSRADVLLVRGVDQPTATEASAADPGS